MYKKKICFIAQFPPPIHGLSVAVDVLYGSELRKKYDFEKVDITSNKKFLKNIIKIAVSKANCYYFTISQTTGGNIRDLLILGLLNLQKKKCLIHLHGGYYRTLVDYDLRYWQKKCNYRVMNKVAGAIVLGDSLKGNFEGMVDGDKIFVVKNCVDENYMIGERELVNKLNDLEGKKVKHILYLSNMISSKGYPLILEMAKIEKEHCILGEEKKLHFDFAGAFFSEEEENFFWSFVQKNQLQEYVSYHGKVTGAQKKELLAQSDIFMLLTTYPKEGQPISILEAMANGLLIVTTNHAGIPDIVSDGENGLVFSIDTSVDRIYQKILQTNITKMKEICLYNYEYVKKEFSQQKYISSMKNVFETMM